jgi:hypothetical protein
MDSPLRPKSVSGVEQSVDDYRWQKAAAASPQFARNEPKYDRAECYDCARLKMDDTEQSGAERNGTRERATEQREANLPPSLYHRLD